MNEHTSKLKQLLGSIAGGIVINVEGEETCQVTGPLGTDPRYPDKWLIANNQANCYIIFKAEDVREIKKDKIYVRYK
jgi:hypothetical protein